MKLEKNKYEVGDLLYWNDYWCQTCGIGIFLGYVLDFNVIDLYSNVNEKEVIAWANLLITKENMLEKKMFPQTSISLISDHQDLKDFQHYVSNFRFKINK